LSRFKTQNYSGPIGSLRWVDQAKNLAVVDESQEPIGSVNSFGN
jgi:hypothetical protein